MRKLVLSIFMSLDGSITGPDGEFEGPAWSDEVARHWSDYALADAGRLLFGRVNFGFMKAFWGAAETDSSSPAASSPHAPIMNRLPKTVVSTTLGRDIGWNGTLAQGDLAEVVAELKRRDEPGDLYCFGGAGMAQSLVARDLADEYHFLVTPNLMGGGLRLFGEAPRIDLDLFECRALDTGAVLLRYKRKR